MKHPRITKDHSARPPRSPLIASFPDTPRRGFECGCALPARTVSFHMCKHGYQQRQEDGSWKEFSLKQDSNEQETVIDTTGDKKA